MSLGAKYGAESYEYRSLLEKTKELDLQVVGVSFHVGSGSMKASAFSEAIQSARNVFDLAVILGLPPLTILDIGGGFVSEGGGQGDELAVVASAIREALDEHFPEETDVRVIAEPGRYFAEAAFTLAVNVIGVRFREQEAGKGSLAHYWINDGLYGSMNNIIFDYAVLNYRVIRCSSELSNEKNEQIESIVFGQTCDSMDTVLKNVYLPKLECGDWLVFSRMGAYTNSAASSFNGFDCSFTTFVVHSE